jgi:hypothetical protein
LFALENQTAGELAQLRTEREQMEKTLTDRDRKHALQEALRKAGIVPRFTDGVMALLLDRVVMIGDQPMVMGAFGAQHVNDFVSQWSMSEEGEVYRRNDAPRRANRRAQPGSFAARVAGMK